MTKDTNKSNPKTKHPPAVKKVKKPEIAKSKTTPKGLKVKRTPTSRNYFTVQEDSQILDAIEKSGVVVSSAAKAISTTLPNRTIESIRDRIKRYLKNLSANDKKEIHAQARKNPKSYAYFKKVNKDKKLEKFASIVPSLQNRELVRRPRTSKKKIQQKPTISPDEKYKWIASKLQNKDSYFKLEFSVQFLADIFNNLIEEHNVSPTEIHNYITNVHCDESLSNILDHFKVKKN